MQSHAGDFYSRVLFSIPVDAILPVGVLIKGDTLHFEVIAKSVTDGLMQVGLSTGLPIIFGVLTVNDEQQVKKSSQLFMNYDHSPAL